MRWEVRSASKANGNSATKAKPAEPPLIWTYGRDMPEGERVEIRLLEAQVEEHDKAERKAARKHALGSEKSDRISAAIKMAQTEEGIPIGFDRLDADPWLLSVSNGVFTPESKTPACDPPCSTSVIRYLRLKLSR